VVIACASLKMAIKTTTNDDILRIANNIRCPDPSELFSFFSKLIFMAF
jgi:hypothetical protein